MKLPVTLPSLPTLRGRTPDWALTVADRARASRWTPVVPAIVVLGLLTGLPFFRLLWTSLHRSFTTTPDDTSFVGADNLLSVLTGRDWWVAVAVTLAFLALAVALQLVLAAAFAATLRRLPWGGAWLPVLVIVPFALLSVVTATTWHVGLTEGFGPEWFGYDGEGRPAAFVAAVAAEVWRGTGVTTLVLLAGLGRLSPTLLESAVADGATALQRIVRVALPAAAPAVAVAVVWRALDALGSVEVPLLAASSGASSDFVPVLLWDTTFSAFELGLGAAMGLVLLVVAAILGTVLAVVLRVRRAV